MSDQTPQDSSARTGATVGATGGYCRIPAASQQFQSTCAVDNRNSDILTVAGRSGL